MLCSVEGCDKPAWRKGWCMKHYSRVLRLGSTELLRDWPKRYTVNGETRSIDEWAEHLSIHKNTLRSRIKQGWPLELALTAPVNNKGIAPGYQHPDDFLIKLPWENTP